MLPLCASLSAQQQGLIQEVQVHGNRRIPGDTIRARIFTRAGDPYDDGALERDFRSVWNTGYFEDVRMEREQTASGWIVHIYVKEKPNIRRVEYKGLNSVTQSDVIERFKKAKVGLSVENPYDATKVKKAEVVLKELLAEHGRQFATIRTEIAPIPPAAVAITINVKEGPKVKVGKIKFEGNKVLSDRALRRAMRFSRPIGIPHSFVLENIFSKTYDATKLSHDVELVRNAYQERGYFKAVVDDPQTKMRDTGRNLLWPFSGGGKAVDISVPVAEGERYRLGTITFKGNKTVTNVAALRGLFPMKDGEILNVANIRKGLENLRKAYGELGYINFTSIPDTKIDEDKKLISLEIDIEEGKPFFVRRIEFTGNTTTRDKVIRRELAIEEGQVFNSRLWEFSVLRLNQLGYFDQLKPEDDTERKLNEKEGNVDLTLKVKEKGKNEIGLQGGVAGLSGSFIGLTYKTNNFLGLGETLEVSFMVGSRERNIVFGFTEPYLFDRPIQFGFTVFSQKYDYNQAKLAEIQSGQRLNLSQQTLDVLQNFSQNRTGFTVSSSYQLKRSLKRVGLTYSFDRSTVSVFSEASRLAFEQVAFREPSSQNSLEGVVTSKVMPYFTRNSVNHSFSPTGGTSIYVGGEFAGLGGNVRLVRPIVEWKQFRQLWAKHVFGYRLQGSYVTGYGGRVTPPYERFWLGGENDVRGFDIRSVSPMILITDRFAMPLENPPTTTSGLTDVPGASAADPRFVPLDPSNPRAGIVTVPIPIRRLSSLGGDTSFVANAEYRVPIVGQVAKLAFFTDFGMTFITRASQLRISDVQFNDINNLSYGCPTLNADFSCGGTQKFNFPKTLSPLAGTNYVPRMSSGVELQVMMPVINAPMRIYWAYNPLRLDTTVQGQNLITRDMFPAGSAGDFTFLKAKALFAPEYQLREPRKTFRFTVSTTF